MSSDFEVGDVVRLTGADWARLTDDNFKSMQDEEVGVTEISGIGDPLFEWDNRTFAIFNDQDGDFSATLVRKAGEW